jgi:[histone H3]-lysine36 N-dimethyltransferase SETMAR
MSQIVFSNDEMRASLKFCYLLKKTAAESHRMLVEAYGEHAYCETQCKVWFRKFKSGDFDLRNEERGRPPKKFEDAELEALLDEDDGQTQQQLAEQLNVTHQCISQRLKAMGMIQKVGRWVPHELTERQQENRKTTCEMLLARYKRKSFLHRIVTGDEKWIYFKNPKRKKSYVRRGQPAKSTARPDRFGKKALLCVFWDQGGVVWYDLLKPGETVNGQRYQQQLTDLNRAIRQKRPEYQLRHDKIILLDDNAPPHRTRDNKNLVESFSWEQLTHPPYSPDLAPSDYHLFSSMGHALAEQHFNSYEEVKKWLDDWFASKDEQFFWRGIHKLPERWEKCVASNGHYFEE